MRKVTRSRKYKKRVSKKNKTRRNKKVRRVNRRKLRGGTNHLGEVFLEIVKNKKEGANDEKIAQLKEEFRTAINDDVKFDKVMELLDYYEYLKRDYESELEANEARDKKDSQGSWMAQQDYAKFLLELEDDYGIEIDL
jgi:hypothetical protein